MSDLSAIQAKANSKIKEAIAFDTDGQHALAIEAYTTGVGWWLHVRKHTQNKALKDSLTKKTAEYMERAEVLKTSAGGSQGASKGEAASTLKPGEAPPKEDKEKERMAGALSEAIQVEKSDVKWSDVAGLELAKEALKEAVVLPIEYPQLFRGQRKPWRGILLYGPPGTGKSFLAKALANEADATFFSVSSSDLVSKWVGESEKMVRTLFEEARRLKPAIVFIDEIDSLCSERSDTESESARRIKTEFLVQMDGVGKDQTGVLLLGATNLPWALDKAVKRRFQRRVYIPLPEAVARRVMLENFLRKCEHTLAPDEVGTIAEQCDGFSGSDIKVMLAKALMVPLTNLRQATHWKEVTAVDPETGKTRDDMLAPCSPGDRGAMAMEMSPDEGVDKVPSDRLAEPSLGLSDFITCMLTAKPSVAPEDLVPFEEWTATFGEDASAGGAQQPDEAGPARFKARLPAANTSILAEGSLRSLIRSMQHSLLAGGAFAEAVEDRLAALENQ